MTLLREIEDDAVLRDHTPAATWLRGKVAIDVARITGQPTGAPKKPIPKGAVAFAVITGIACGTWTYWIVRDGFVWYSVFPGTFAFLMLISILGMVTNREIPAEDQELPAGAVPMRTSSASEQVTAAIALASSEQDAGDRFGDGGQAGVALGFLRLMREGRVAEGQAFADENWLLCRIQAWVWNNRDTFGTDTTKLDELAVTLLSDRRPSHIWKEFLSSESEQFAEAWRLVDLDTLGVASRRRRIARDYDLVILAPTGKSGGYFVTTATAIPNAMTFVMHRTKAGWRVASHAGTAPPAPGWPPAWWIANDPTISALPEDYQP